MSITTFLEGPLLHFLCCVARLSLYMLRIDPFPSRKLASLDISYFQVVVLRFLFLFCVSPEVLWRPRGEARLTL